MSRRVFLVVAAAVIAAGLTAAVPASALTVPRACGQDEHVQCAVYDRDEVYRVAVERGKATLIELEPGEKVLDDGVGVGGEPKSWVAGVNSRGMLLQPASAGAFGANLTVVTSRRVYSFSLVRVPKGATSTWLLRFDYPDTRAKEAAAAARKTAEADAVLQGASRADVPRNEAYSMRGDVALAPTSLWDDGVFTYFRYATGRDLPRVFQILPDGAEAQTNFHMDGDTIVVHSTAREFVIRLGRSVLGIRNDGYAPEGLYNNRGTTVPGAVRVMREREDGGAQ